MKRFKSIVMAAIAVVFAATTYTTPVDAQSSALSITPKKNYIIEPGKSVEDKLIIRNLDRNQPLVLSLRVIDFSYTDDGGTPKLFLAEDAPQTTWSLKPFMKVPESVTIAPGSSKSLDMSVSIPEGHGAGSYYSAIIYSSAPPGSGGHVGLNASGVTLVFTTIPGKVHEDLKLEKFGAYFERTPQREAAYRFITTEEPLHMAYTLKNNGNVTEAPVGSITLNDMWGHEYKITNVNPSKSLALIGQSRTFVSCIKLAEQAVDFNGRKTEAKDCVSAGLWPGLYTASLDLYYGQNGNMTREVTGSTIFWYLPWWFIIVCLVVLAIVVYFIWRIYYKIRRRMNGGVKFKKSHRRK